MLQRAQVVGCPWPGLRWGQGRRTRGPRGATECVNATFSFSFLFRCDFEDTAQYRVSAMNSKGELSAFASVVVKSASPPSLQTTDMPPEICFVVASAHVPSVNVCSRVQG